MEPININVSVSLSDKTLEKLHEIACLLSATVICKANHDEVKNLGEALKKEEAEPEPVQKAKKVEDPAPAPPATPATQSTGVTEEAVTLDTLFEAVKSARQDRGVKAATVKAVFAEFGIPNSAACPENRRAELLVRINALTA